MASRRAAASARLVLVTAADQKQAASIARALVQERLAACVNLVGPIRSIYRWQSAVEDEQEYLLVIKTRARLYAKLERRVRQLHTYQTPEVLSLAIDDGSAPYLSWLLESTASQ
jgi:periplasmic divalent cation tolerance protein